MLTNRALKAEALLEKHGLDAMLFTDMLNIRYLSGFTGSDGVLIFTRDTSVFLTDSRYLTQAKDQVNADVLEYKEKIQGIVSCLSEVIGQGTVGLESTNITCDFYDELLEKSSDSLSYRPVKDASAIRSIKDEDEIRLISKAVDISTRALESVIENIRPGVSENEVALELEIVTRSLGSEVKAFDFIVASGERGALPHGVASEKRIKKGDVVTIDFGSRYQGYFSDETVNFAIGEVKPEMVNIHDIVLKAHDLAINSIKPGVFLSEIDKIARDFISEKGYGTYFGHGLGHGVGLDVHESPRVSPQSKAVAEEGMVFTVEPGIYVPGMGGVRIEDMIVVTKDGYRTLTSLPKELRVL